MIINNAIISLTKHRRDMGVAAKVSVAQNVPINEKKQTEKHSFLHFNFCVLAYFAPLQLHRAFGYKFSNLAIFHERNEISG